ncbi:unnamed protein product [Urochloa humidicola]
MVATVQSWSGIPLDPAGLVLGRLYTHVYRVRFAAVAGSAANFASTACHSASLAGTKALPQPTASGSWLWLVYRRVRCLVLVDPCFSGATMTLLDPSSVHLPDKGDELMIPTTRVMIPRMVMIPLTSHI